MWLLNTNTYKLEEFHGDDRPEYAILSHTWEKEEVTFVDVRDGSQATLRGWSKIQSCCKQALADDYAYVWADTCCIDKRNIVDLSEALNSMFRWYKEAAVCYTYLSDVSVAEDNEVLMRSTSSASTNSDQRQSGAVLKRSDLHSDRTTRNQEEDDGPSARHSLGSTIIRSRWFTRGWTLQELLAPKSLVFYDVSWTALGTRIDFLSDIERRTSIPHAALQDFEPEDYCIAQKMAWAAGRRTTRPEDRAYSLLGLLGVSLNLIYGEGSEEAFFRLQRKLIKRLDDTSILAWNRRVDVKYSHWLLAPSPDAFEGCHIYQEYISCAIGLDLSKTALMGTFNTRIDCFSFSCACLGHFRTCSTDELQSNLRDGRGLTHVNTVGILLKESSADVYEPIMLDGKRHLLSDYPFRHLQNSFHRRKLSISPVPPEVRQYSSKEIIDHRYYPDRNHIRFDPALICPGKFLPVGERGHRLSRPVRQEDISTKSRVYDRPTRDKNEPLVIRPGKEDLHCFVVNEPNFIRGRVIQFGYDLTRRPTILEGHLRDRPSSKVFAIDGFQHIDTTKGFVEVASRQVPNNYLGLNDSISNAKQWADSPVFDQLVGGNNTDGALLQDDTHVIRLGDNIKVIFIPQGSGHRVLLAFRGNFDAIHSFPRAWLWPVQESEASPERSKENRKGDGSFAIRLKGMFGRD